MTVWPLQAIGTLPSFDCYHNSFGFDPIDNTAGCYHNTTATDCSDRNIGSNHMLVSLLHSCYRNTTVVKTNHMTIVNIIS